jgi:flagellar biosynthesis protein FliR
VLGRSVPTRERTSSGIKKSQQPKTALASLGRLNSQLQMLTMAFPAKMLIALGLLAWLLVLFPRVFNHSADDIAETIGQLIYR